MSVPAAACMKAVAPRPEKCALVPSPAPPVLSAWQNLQNFRCRRYREPELIPSPAAASTAASICVVSSGSLGCATMSGSSATSAMPTEEDGCGRDDQHLLCPCFHLNFQLHLYLYLYLYLYFHSAHCYCCFLLLAPLQARYDCHACSLPSSSSSSSLLLCFCFSFNLSNFLKKYIGPNTTLTVNDSKFKFIEV